MESNRIGPFLYLTATSFVLATVLVAKRNREVRQTGSVTPINVSLTLAGNAVPVGGVVNIRCTVTKKAANLPVASASVTIHISRPGGITTITVPTDASGVAEWKYKVQKDGAYTVTATASSNGSAASADLLAFTVDGESIASQPMSGDLHSRFSNSRDTARIIS